MSRRPLALGLVTLAMLLAGCATAPAPAAEAPPLPVPSEPGEVRAGPPTEAPAPPTLRLACVLDPCPVVAFTAGAEPWVAVDPRDSERAVAAAMATRIGDVVHPWMSVALTTDGGRTWAAAPLPGGPNEPDSEFREYTFAADPTVAFTPDGTVVISALLGRQTPPYYVVCSGNPACGQQFASANLLDLAVWRSEDGGATWTPGPVIVKGEGGPAGASGAVNQGATVGRYPDRQSLFADPVTGRLHLVWAVRESGPGGLAASRSDDGGLTWTPPELLRGAKYGAWGAALNGTVVIAFRDGYNGTYESMRSTDGGDTWTDPIHLSDYPSYATAPVALWREGDALHAAVAVANGTLEEPRLWLRVSRDAGATWDAPTEPFGNRSPTTRPLPALGVDPETGLGLLTVYEPAPDDPENLTLHGIPLARGAAGIPLPLSVNASSPRAAFDYSYVAATPAGALAAWGELNEHGGIRIAAAPLRWGMVESDA